MDRDRDGKRKKDKYDEDDEKRRHKKSRRARSRSRSYEEHHSKESRRRRRRSNSRSAQDDIRHGRNEKRGRDAPNEPEVQKDAPVKPERRAKDTDMLNTRTGGAYIPPARLRMMQAQITDKSSMAYQRLAWEALKKSIHGHINKINVGNIGIIIKELLKENIVRGRGLLCRSVIQAQAASPTFTNVYAALVSAVNSRFPNIGELLLKRLVIQFKRGFKRNDKSICISAASFIAHLVNQRVAHEILALELLTLLVESPTDDSVEVAIAFLKECGQKLTEVSSKGVNAIFEMLRNILHEGQLDKRVQYMIEVMFQVWKDGFKDHPALIEELELVPEEEQFTHLLMLDDATDPQDILNVFKFDEKYEENEQKYKNLSKEILGSDAESGEEGSGESGSEESEDDDDEEPKKEMTIIDNTETNLVALRRTIYLTINSSLDFEECAHKLMKMQLKPGQEVELCHMFLDCCAEQRTYEKFYGLLAQRFCNINRIYIGPFEEIFKDSYSTAHRLDTNRLRNVSKFFAHLLFTDSISWEALECVKLNEEDTTSSSRIYIKILFQELAEYMGLKKLNERLQDPTLQEAFSGLFPRDNPRNTRFSINFFTSIGLGGLTDELREHLKQMPKNVPAPPTEIKIDSESSSSDSSSDSSSSSSDDSSSSDSEEDANNKKKKKDKKKSKEKDKTAEDENAQDNVERWGHEGFYDTYGQGARRYESNQRENENFKPRDRRDRDTSRNGPDRNNRSDDYNRDNSSRDDGRRNNDDKDTRRRDYEAVRNRRGDEKDDERNRRNNERDDRNDNRYNTDGRRSYRDNDRDEGRNRRDEMEERGSRRDDERNDKRYRRDYEKEDPRSHTDDGNDGRRNRRDDDRDDNRNRRDDDRNRRDDDRNIRDDDRNRRDDDRNIRDDDRNRRDNDRNRRDADRNIRDDDRNRRDDDRNRRDDDDKNRRVGDKNRRDDDDKIRRDDDRNRRDDDRNIRDDDRNRRDDDRNRRDDDRNRRDDDDKNRRVGDKNRRDDDDKIRRDDDRNRRDDDKNRRDDDRNRRDDDEDRQNGKNDKRHRVDDERHEREAGDRRNRRNDDRVFDKEKDQRKEKYDEEQNTKRSKNIVSKDEKKRRNSTDSECESTPKESTRKNKNKRKDKDTSSDEETRKRKKDKKKGKDDSSDDERQERKSKKDKRKKKNKKESDDSDEDGDGWDIRSGSEVKEVSGRYWGSFDPNKREASPQRKEKKRNRSRQRS